MQPAAQQLPHARQILIDTFGLLEQHREPVDESPHSRRHAPALHKRHRDRGLGAAAVHPGVIETELGRHLDPARIRVLIDQITKERAAEGKEPFQWKTVPQGAATSVWAAVVAPAEEIGGKYCENCHVGEVVADSASISGVSEGVRGYALDPNNAEALWRKSEEMVGEKF